MNQGPTATVSLISGGLAGTAVDVSLFPLDTIKTRLQASGGFFRNGGWTGIYRGIGSVIAGSAPSAGLFFITYDTLKNKVNLFEQRPLQHMFASSVSEVVACGLRVPTEVIKQRAQASQYNSSLQVFQQVLRNGELYKGFGSTVFREIPFTVIQFPLWEWMKTVSKQRRGRTASSIEAALYGSIAGGVAAAVTTPLDVIKTRIMLSSNSGSIVKTGIHLLRNEGASSLWSGIWPRVAWISIGGAIFLGIYDAAEKFLSSIQP